MPFGVGTRVDPRHSDTVLYMGSGSPTVREFGWIRPGSLEYWNIGILILKYLENEYSNILFCQIVAGFILVVAGPLGRIDAIDADYWHGPSGLSVRLSVCLSVCL